MCMLIHLGLCNVNSGGAVVYRNSAEVPGGTKPLSSRSRCTGWRPAVGELASFQQASGELHDEAWAGRVQSSSLRFSQEVQIGSWCAVTVPSFSFLLLGHLGRAGKLGVGLAGHHWKNGSVRGVVFKECLAGREGVFSAFSVAGDWVKKGSHHTAWSVSPAFFVFLLVLAWARHGCRAHTGKRCWALLSGLWSAIAPMMKPWCAEEDVPTPANLNLYRGRSSHVGWHSDDERLFLGVWGGEAHCVGELWDPGALQVEEQVLSGRRCSLVLA